jgi:hypothetical protein
MHWFGQWSCSLKQKTIENSIYNFEETVACKTLVFTLFAIYKKRGIDVYGIWKILLREQNSCASSWLHWAGIMLQQGDNYYGICQASNQGHILVSSTLPHWMEWAILPLDCDGIGQKEMGPYTGIWINFEPIFEPTDTMEANQTETTKKEFAAFYFLASHTCCSL